MIVAFETFHRDAFMHACKTGYYAYIKHHRDHASGWTIDNGLNSASIHGHLDIVKCLYPMSHSDTDDNVRLIRISACNNHIEVLKYYINDCKIDPSLSDNNALRAALFRHARKSIDFLLNDYRVHTKMHCLLNSAKPEVVKKTLKILKSKYEFESEQDLRDYYAFISW